MSPERGTFTLLPNDINMTTYTFSFSDAQISILRTSLDTRIQRIDSMIQIFSEDTEDAGATWMIAQYNIERAEAEGLLQDLSNATSFLPTA
jgi:hypothetical protein